MYLNKIQDFLPKYENIEIREFSQILNLSNTQAFTKSKLEKDFLLSLILIKFWEIFPDLIFKWGTCLNKIYFPYFRLSEDLDFVVCFSGGRTSRKTLLRNYEERFIAQLEILWLTLSFKRKVNEYNIWMWEFEYTSALDNRTQTIKLDISIKKQLERSTQKWSILTIFKDIYDENIFWTHSISCIDLQEALAEKIRAALTRKLPAIRDFFDIWYIQNNSDFDFDNSDFLQLVNIKLAEVNYEYTLEDNYSLLEKQIKTDLQPVLHQEYDFSLKETYQFILSFQN